MKRQQQFTPFDVADHLKTEADIAAYLEAIAEEDDPQLLTKALGDVVRARNIITKLAGVAGITRAGLYKAFSADGNPSFATVYKVARGVGLRVVFKPVLEVGTYTELQRYDTGTPRPSEEVVTRSKKVSKQGGHAARKPQLRVETRDGRIAAKASVGNHRRKKKS